MNRRDELSHKLGNISIAIGIVAWIMPWVSIILIPSLFPDHPFSIENHTREMHMIAYGIYGSLFVAGLAIFLALISLGITNFKVKRGQLGLAIGAGYVATFFCLGTLMVMSGGLS